MTTWRVELVGSFGRRHDAFVDAEPATTVGELGRALEEEGFRGWPLGLHGRSLGTDETLAEVRLEHGSTLTCGGAGLAVADPGAGRYVVVVAGPDAGRSVALPADGTVTVGRAGADLAVDDPFLSSHHCTFR
ncbi:MAG TPA: FHA domain-containing protein, partial [Ilumatobacteraceae bacterium]|nr:FHA domain-containing protein [Ilumatobacteraceae bacterium]